MRNSQIGQIWQAIKLKYVFIVLFTLVLFIAGCQKDSLTYDGPPTVCFTHTSEDLFLDWRDTSHQVVWIDVQLIGGSMSESIDIEFEITGNSTAQADKDYRLLKQSPLRIAARSYQGSIGIEIIGSSFEVGNERLLELRLVDAPIKIGRSLNTLRLNIHK